METQAEAFLLQLVTVLLLGVGTNSQQCPLPSQSDISTSLRTYLVSTEGDSPTITVNLQNYHFTCQAVAASDMYRSLSVAVQYTKTDSGVTSAVQYDQFQLECVTGSPNHYQLPSSAPFEDDVSPSLLTTPTRRDCQFCTGLSSGPAGLDTTANCFACSSTCLGVGQGACAADGTTCCPFFNTDGSCTTACPTNYTASSDTNYTCSECAIPCSLGHEPNTACDGCVPVHICVTNDPCQNGATCNVGNNSNTDYTCSCTGTFAGENCTECAFPCPLGNQPNSACDGCIPVHICLTSNPCQNGATCDIGTNSNTNYTCSCTQNIFGNNCTECVLPCPLDYAPNSTCTECVPVHICVTSNPCQNGASCNIGTNSNDYTCSCPPNYSGQNCDQCVLTCPMSYELNSACECVPVHICLTSNPCQNGATCNIGTNNNTDYTCSCPPNYSGQDCDVSQCTLPCPLGYTPNMDCTGCDPVHICVTNDPCQNRATCNISTNSNTDYTCLCPANYTGQNCEICVTPCPSGYEPISTCTGECVPVHICITNDPCQNGATCDIGPNSNTDYTCLCLPLFTDKNCSTRGNPCSPNPCENGGRCSIDGVEYSCACSNSWRGTNCTECGVIDCAQCSQSREGCEMCNIGYNPDNLQCTAIPSSPILMWWHWVLIGAGVLFFIFFLIIVPVMVVWKRWKDKKDEKPKVQPD